MRRRLAVHGALLALLCIAPVVHGQVGQPAELSETLSTQDRREAERQRAALVERGRVLRQKLAAFTQQCGHVAETDSSSLAQCRSNQAELVAEIRQYNRDVDDFNQMVGAMASRWKEKFAGCANAMAQRVKDRDAVERQIRSNELNQQELAEWSSLNAKAQKDAVLASVKYFVGEYAGNIDPVRGSVSKLERRAAEVAQKSVKSRKLATRTKYAAQLGAIVKELQPMQHSLYAKVAGQTLLDADKTWELARDTMRHEFRVAARQNQSIREMLQDPEFKKTFAGDDTDTPGDDVMGTLVDQAIEDAGKFLATAEEYDRLVGPTIRAGVFVRDVFYSDWLSAVSTARVVQASDLAGSFAKSSAVLQGQYKKSVDAVAACRQNGYVE